MYALHQQATVGPCTEAKPWGWNVVESAKWESWNQLGNMSSVEAMRLYVKMVEDDQVCHLMQCHACGMQDGVRLIHWVYQPTD